MMSHIRSVNTKPEVALRRALWRRGFRYRLNVKILPGSPDIVLPKHRTVVFVHGCFWHAHKGCNIYHLPQTNTEFWQAKVTRNQERDQEVWRQLEAKGWSVVIVWECELMKARFRGLLCPIRSSLLRCITISWSCPSCNDYEGGRNGPPECGQSLIMTRLGQQAMLLVRFYPRKTSSFVKRISAII